MNAKVVKRQKLLREQVEQITYDKKWGAARGGTRAGKSMGFAIWLYIERIQKYPLANHVVVGADYEQLRRGFFDLMVGLLESWGWEEGVDYRYREQPAPTLYFPRLGKHVRLRSLSTKLVERIRGMSIQTLVLEEPQTWGTSTRSGKDLYDILIGRLSHSQTTAVLYPEMETQGRMSFNPPPVGTWLHDLIEHQWPAAGYKCWRMSPRTNWLLHDREAYVRDLEVNLDQSRWSSEIDGHWATVGGKVYRGFDSSVHGVGAPGLPEVGAIDLTKPLYWTHDFNVALMCSVIAQPFTQKMVLDGVDRTPGRPASNVYRYEIPGWQRRIIRVIGELAIPDAGAPNVLRAFIEQWGDIARKCPGVILFGDPAGGSRSHTADSESAARTPWAIIEQGLTKAGIKWTKEIPSHAPVIIDRINETNAQFGTGEGYGMTVNIEACPVLVKDFNEVKPSKDGKDIEKKAGTLLTHASDSVGYLCTRFRALARERAAKRRDSSPRTFMGR